VIPSNTPGGGLEGASVIVTGGGTGIGRACAARLAADGAHVTICGRTESKLIDAAKRIEAAAGHGGTVRYIVADTTDEDDIQRVVAEGLKATGVLDGFIANAGGGGTPAPLHLQKAAEFLRVLHLNVLSTFLSLKYAVPQMVAAGGGSFVAISSIAGCQTHRYFGAYTIAKGGIDQMMRNAADEYGPVKVRCNSVRPGFIATEVMEAIPRDGSLYQGWMSNTPMEGEGQPEDVAGLVRFLIGPDARWITGAQINIDGGSTLRSGPDFTPYIEPRFGQDAMLAKTMPAK
jgi:7-alpha-hydroxysteroid dehydrogenase